MDETTMSLQLTERWSMNYRNNFFVQFGKERSKQYVAVTHAISLDRFKIK